MNLKNIPLARDSMLAHQTRVLTAYMTSPFGCLLGTADSSREELLIFFLHGLAPPPGSPLSVSGVPVQNPGAFPTASVVDCIPTI